LKSELQESEVLGTANKKEFDLFQFKAKAKKSFEAALASGQSAPWNCARVMIVGEGRSSSFSTHVPPFDFHLSVQILRLCPHRISTS
jgi:hypothetical protein